MKPVTPRVLIMIALFCCRFPAGHAEPPKLSLMQQSDSGEVRPGEQVTCTLNYTQPQGDRPSSGGAKMILQTPLGQVVQPGLPSAAGDPAAAGVPITWTFTPKETGAYSYHFEVTSATGETARYPEDGSELQFQSVNLWVKFAVFAGGTVIAMAFLPFVVYVLARSANRQGDPSAAARVALLFGVLASYGLFVYLFLGIFGTLLLVLGGVIALALLIVLFARRPAAA